MKSTHAKTILSPLLALLMTASVSCGDPNEESNACGAGDELHVKSQTYCVYEQSIIETGFECPQNFNHSQQYGHYTVCGGNADVLTPELRVEMHRRYDEAKLPPVDATLCQSTSTCAMGESCDGGACVTPAMCTVESGCAPGGMCVNGVCEPLVNPECTENSGCMQGQLCEAGTCVTPAMCTVESGCAPGGMCVNGVCEPLVGPECLVDADCDVNETCESNACVSSPPVAEVCDDLVDNDNDGLIDCADDECSASPMCQTTSCQNDGECTLGQICLNNTCTAQTPCASDNDCGSGDVCVEGVCEPRVGPECLVDADCPAGEFCLMLSNECVPSTSVVEVCDDLVDNDNDGLIDCADDECSASPMCQTTSCQNDGECTLGQICLNNTCTAQTPCASDNDCGVGSTCVQNFCASNAPQCLSDGDCPAGQVCSSASNTCRLPVPDPVEACDDGLDNDNDGLIDCQDDECLADPSCDGGSCASDADCGLGAMCQSGKCASSSPACATDADCAAGQVCMNNMCQMP